MHTKSELLAMKMVSEVPLKNCDKMSVVPASYKIDVRAITQSVKKMPVNVMLATYKIGISSVLLLVQFLCCRSSCAFHLLQALEELFSFQT